MSRFPKLMGFVLGGALAFAMLQSLSACSDRQISLDQVVQVFGVSGIDQAGQKELNRFYDIFDRYSNDPTDLRYREHFRDAFRLVRANYVVKVDDAKLIDGAIKGLDVLKLKAGAMEPSVLAEAALDGMMATLDPHSNYLNPDEYKETRIITKGEFGGLGIEVTQEEDLIKVVSPIEDTPAFRAGIQAGDLITHLDGMPVKGMSLSEAVKVMRGPPGKSITLTLQRTGKAPFDVVIVRAVIKIHSVRGRLQGDIGYLRVTSFTENVGRKLEKTMADIFAKAVVDGVKVKGVVLDLRNNPGGLLEQSLLVSDSFLESGEIVSVRERNPHNDRVYMAEPGDMTHGLPVVVLINEGSASASEIVAGALKDQKRAVIMGRRSFGKGSVQTIQPLPVEGGLHLTIARYFAPSGHTIQARGVNPDIILQRARPENGKKEQKIPRESDSPRALGGDNMKERVPTATVMRDTCPKVSEQAEDRELGCAIAYLHAGSSPGFLAALRP